MLKRVAVLLLCSASLCGVESAQGAAARGRFEVSVENGVRVRMRDGVTLAADLYRPKGEGKFPVLVERTPYNRKGDFQIKYELDLWVTSNLFKAGHRIRLYVSSSNFPRFSRNPNTGEPGASATRAVKARQTVYHDAARPSSVTLPVIPR